MAVYLSCQLNLLPYRLWAKRCLITPLSNSFIRPSFVSLFPVSSFKNTLDQDHRCAGCVMEAETVALLLGGGVLAAAVNAIAGGGSFFTFPALIASGLAPLEATITAAVAIYPASFVSVAAYFPELRANIRRFAPLAGISLIFGGIGGWALVHSGDAVFRQIVPWLLLFATALFAAGPYIGGRLAALAKGGEPGPRQRFSGLLLHIGTSLYGGYFGAGIGIIMLTTLTLTEGHAFHRINAAKHPLAVAIQVFAMVLFVTSGMVDWPRAAVIAVASLFGGWYGVKLARRIPVPVLRGFVLSTGAALSLWFFIQGS